MGISNRSDPIHPGPASSEQVGAQWPMIISGGQSMLAGVSFIVMAHAPNQGITTLAGYAAFGAFLFPAIRLPID